MDLLGKHVLITGASRGIGRALSQVLAKQKAHLIITLRRADLSLEQELRNCGALSVQTLIADFSTREGVDLFCQQIDRQNISVDILVNNAGLLTGGLLEEQKLDDIYAMMQVNLLAVTQLCHFFIPRMLAAGGGKIVNNASVSGEMVIPCANTYAASKAGVVALTESLQMELSETPVSTLLLVTPGVKTEMFDNISDKYKKNLDLSFLTSISAEDWASQIVEAICDGRTHLYPRGSTRWGLLLNQYAPSLFRKIFLSKFKR